MPELNSLIVVVVEVVVVAATLSTSERLRSLGVHKTSDAGHCMVPFNPSTYNTTSAQVLKLYKLIRSENFRFILGRQAVPILKRQLLHLFQKCFRL